MPTVHLPSTGGGRVALDQLGAGRTVIYLYPLTGRPDVDLPIGWEAIPGARGCTAEACDLRDHHTELLAASADAVFGLSAQTTEYQSELVTRLHLPFAILSDPELRLAAMVGVPIFEVDGAALYRRQTLVVTGGVIEHVFYPVFPPDQHATEVLAWLRGSAGAAD